MPTAHPAPCSTIVETMLLHRHLHHGDRRARAEFIERTMPIVHHVAQRYDGRGQDYEELVQVGALGLTKAVDRFDLERGVRFTSFAIPTITGEIRRHFRDHSRPVRLPRGLQEREALLTTSRRRLALELQRTPTVREIATAAGLSVDEALEGLAATREVRATSLDATLGRDEDGGTLGDRLGTLEQGYDHVDDSLQIRRALNALQHRERAVVLLRYAGDMTQQQIAERLGLSQMHVSRLLHKALQRMNAAVDGTPARHVAR